MRYCRSQEVKVVLFVLLSSTILIINAYAGLEPGKKAPDFQLPSLADGKEIALKDFLGKVVILHLWKCI